MAQWNKIKKVMLRYFATISWYIVVALTLAYGGIAYWLLSWAGEAALTEQQNFVYWLITTASTVGYGDFSPQTEVGKWVVALYIIPVGLSLFAWVIGHFAAWLGLQWKKGAKGLKPIHLTDHILVIGWNGNRTLQLLNLIIRERDSSEEHSDIVLCVKADIENPMPDQIEFVKVESFNNDEGMDRASISFAKTILIDNPDDDVTMTTALYCAKRNPKAHQVAYFNDDSLVGLLQTHCPQIECTPSVAVEMLAKSAFDPGSSILHHDLLSVDDGQAQYSLSVPNIIEALTFETAFLHFKRDYNAIIISIAPQGDVQKMTVNPKLNSVINGGDKVFYIADERVHGINWQGIASN